jgi:hypothetical protein
VSTRNYELCAIVVAAMSWITLQNQAPNWPSIQALHETRTIVNPPMGNITDNGFTAWVKDVGGVPIYKIECHGGNYNNDSSPINFSGDFQCAFFAVHNSKITGGNLLAANTRNEQSTDWWNRGRLRSPQLRGNCLSFPEYSTDRHFKFRGMRVTLRFGDVKWNSEKENEGTPRLEGFQVTLGVVPDPSAKSAISEIPPGPTPPKSCYP